MAARRSRRISGCALLLAGIATLPRPTLAAEADAAEELPDAILVTAPGGSIDLDEARGLGAAAIDASARPDLARALEREVPGITLSEASGNAWQAAIGWRGFSVSGMQGAEQGVAVYLDGVRFNQPFGDVLLLDLLPEAALSDARLNEASPVLGRNALAGSLLLHTADGTSLPGFRAEADVDSVGSIGGYAMLGITSGSADLLVAAEARKDEGWRVASPSRLYRAFAKARLNGEGRGIELSALGADTDLAGNGVAPRELLDANWNAVFTRPDSTRTRFVRLVAAPWVETGSTGRIELRAHWQHLSRRNANGDLADFGPCDAAPAALCLGDDDEGFAEPLLSGGVAVVADPAVDAYAVVNRGRERTRSVGATLQWQDERETTLGTRRFAIGATWERARTRFSAETELGELEEDRSVESLGPLLASADGGISPASVVSTMSDIALFASAELPLTSRLSVEAGGRLSRNRVVLDDQLGTALDGSHAFTQVSPSIEFDHDLGRGVHASVGFSVTSRIPTPAELSCADPQAPCTLANFFIADPPLKAMTARNWHAGVAASEGALQWRANAWRADTRNDIRMVASTVRGRAYFANLGSTRRQGVEASAEWRMAGWRVAAAYAFTDARFRQEFAMSSPQNPAADERGVIAVSRGDRLTGVPRHALNLFAGVEGRGWAGGLTMRARSGVLLAGDEGNDTPPTPAYAVFDLDGRVALGHATDLVFQLRNLFDRRYVTAGTFSEIDDIDFAEAPGASDPRALAPAAPRRITVSLRTRF